MIAGLLEILSGSTFLTIFSLVTVYLVIAYYYREYGPKDPSLPPVVPYYFPFIGSMITYGMNPIKFMQKYRAIYGDNFTMIMFGRRVTFCLGVDGNHTILNGKHTHFSAEEAYHSLTVPVFGKGVVYDVPNPVLMEQKKIGKNGMTTELLTVYVDLIRNETTEHLKQWGEKGSVGILHDMAKLIIKTAAGCLLGHEIRAKLDDSVADIYHDLDGGFTPMQFMFEWLPLPSYYKRDAAHKKMSDLFYDIVKERRKSEKQNDDVVDALMRNSYKDGTMMTDRQIAHMMIALLMAGQHTSSTTSSWTLLLLAQNPEIQEELLKEQKEVFGEDLEDLSLEGLKKCTLLESCIKEALRLRPPIINIMRYVKQNCEIPNTSYVIPQGYFVMSAPIITQLDEKCFPNAESYLPKRWLDPSVATGTNKTTSEDVVEDYGWATMNSSSARSSYLPFGAGRHRCIGEQFAYMQVSTIISLILRNYRIKLNAEAGFPNVNFATLICSPLDPNLIEYEPRN